VAIAYEDKRPEYFGWLDDNFKFSFHERNDRAVDTLGTQCLFSIGLPVKIVSLLWPLMTADNANPGDFGRRSSAMEILTGTNPKLRSCESLPDGRIGQKIQTNGRCIH
jgi:hypothetical protein